MITSAYQHCSGRLTLLPVFKIPFNGGGGGARGDRTDWEVGRVRCGAEEGSAAEE